MFEGYGRGSRDVVLESRHLVGLFLLFVVISGLFFTLGWVMRGSQQDAVVAAGSAGEAGREGAPGGTAGSTTPAPGAAGSKLSDLDFYRTGDAKKAELPPGKPGKGASGATKTTERKAPSPAATKNPPSNPGSLLSAPLIPRGAVVLQVAAVKNLGDGLALAGALQEKGFPAFVVPPTTDSYYRVQVGPYADPQSANQGRRDLERQGFKSIVKR